MTSGEPIWFKKDLKGGFDEVAKESYQASKASEDVTSRRGTFIVSITDIRGICMAILFTYP
jgi:hypothetical protein